MLTLGEYARYDAIGLAGLVSAREITPLDLLNIAASAVESVNPALNAVINQLYDRARAAIDAGLPKGPFCGVPFLVKDLGIDIAGVATTGGSPMRAHHRATESSTLLRRQEAAGLVVIGQTAVPELAMNWGMASTLFGATANPWDLSRNPGISSGGSAASVAAGVVPMAHGNDGGGSIRVPASCCGLFGLKPSRHRTPCGPAVGDQWMGMVCDHAVTRSVRDSAALLDVTAGPAIGAFYSAPEQTGPFLAEVGRPPGRLRIAVTATAPYGAPTHPDCLAAVMDAGALCEQLGHHVDAIDIPLVPGGWEAFELFLAAEYAAGVDEDEQRLGRPLAPTDVDGVLWRIIERGRGISSLQVARAMRVLHRISRVMGGFLEQYDVVLTPTLAVPPVTHEHFRMSDLDEAGYWRGYLDYMPFTHLFNIAGQPAMSVPLFWSADGLPIGVQFAAQVGQEALLFRLAGQLEAARPWSNRQPPIHVSRAASSIS
jgi:amidase